MCSASAGLPTLVGKRLATRFGPCYSSGDEDEAREGRQHIKVQQLTPEMLGSGGKQIATWGSEANALLLFAVERLLPAYVGMLPAELRTHLVRGGDSAVGIYRICSELRGARTPARKAQDRRQPSRK